MATERKRRQQTRRSVSPLKVNEPGIRNEYGRRSKSGSDLTTTLVVCLCIAVIILIAVLVLYNKKSTPPTPIPVNPSDKKYIVNPLIPPVGVPPIVEVEDKSIETPVKKKKTSPPPVTKAESKKGIDLEISGTQKNPEVSKPVVKEPEKEVKKAEEDDKPVIPRSFMGGLSNPEMEKAKEGTSPKKEEDPSKEADRIKEEERKKKEVQLE